MGWAGGSELAEDVWTIVRNHIPKEKHYEVVDALIDLFENQDCDTMSECSFYGLVWKYDSKTGEWTKRK